jgi:hypothetical protein
LTPRDDQRYRSAFPTVGYAIKSILLIVQLAFGLGLFLCAILPAYPHGVGLTPMVVTNRKAGGYHCHRAALAGETFSSKDEMLKKLGTGKRGLVTTPTKGNNQIIPK